MTISIKAVTPAVGQDAGWFPAGITAYHQETEGVDGFAISAGGHYRITTHEATRLGRYLLDIPEGHGILVLPLAEPVETPIDEDGEDA